MIIWLYFLPPGADKKHSASSWLRAIVTEKSNSHVVVNSVDLEASLLDPIPRFATQLSLDNHSNLAKENAGIGESQIDERLIESLAEHLGATIIAPPEVSPLVSRITPSAAHKAPEAALVGKYFHKIMEYLKVERTRLEESELCILAEQFEEEVVHPQIKASLIEEGKNLLLRYSESKLQKLVASAKTICHEWSYYLNTDSNQFIFKQTGLTAGNSRWRLVFDRLQNG